MRLGGTLTALAVAVAIVLLGSSDAVAFDYDAYKLFTIRELAQGLNRGKAERAEGTFAMAAPRYRFFVISTGQVQEIRPRIKEFIRHWFAAANRYLPSVPALFVREIRVREGAKEYWLPTQEVLIQPLQAECPPGTQMQVFAAWLGADRDDLVFTVNEFECAKRPATL